MVRKKRLKIHTNDNCTHFKQAPEEIHHISFVWLINKPLNGSEGKLM